MTLPATKDLGIGGGVSGEGGLGHHISQLV